MASPVRHPLGPFLQPARRAIHAGLMRLPAPVSEFILFGLKMAWSSLFGGAMLAGLLLTHWVWPAHRIVSRYDGLLCLAIGLQALMLLTRLETFEEFTVICLYHVVGTVMEIFKTHMGSWTYPEPSVFHIGGVPLFTGFMYGTVGSFIARVIKVCDMRFVAYPPAWQTWVLAGLIYGNFFSHHFIPDLRLGLYGLSGLIFWRTKIRFRVAKVVRSMPFLIAAGLTAFFLWVAENIGTFSRTWLYPQQQHASGWTLVPLTKFGAWFLLLIISFVCVSLVIRPRPPEAEPAT